MRSIGDLVRPVARSEIPEPGKAYRQIGVRWWGEGVYERESVDGGVTLYKTLSCIEANDIVYNKIWARHGSVSVVPPELSGCYCSGEFSLHRADAKVLDIRWFYWLTKSRWFWTKCEEQSRGTSGKNRIRPDAFLSIQIPAPPIAEQRRIVAKIDAIATRIDETKRLRQEIRDDANALLHSVFHRLIQGAAYRPLAEVAPIVRRRVEIELDGEYPELGVRSFGRGVFHKPTLIGADLDWQKLYRVHAGDLVISNIKAWEGAIAVASDSDHDRVGSHRYITCVPKEGAVAADFICFYLLTQEGLEQIGHASPGSADRNRTLAMKRLEQVAIPIPGIDRQQDFSALQSKVAGIRQTHAENQTELDALLPAVLDKAFKGML